MGFNYDKSRSVTRIDSELANSHGGRMEKNEFEFEGCSKVASDNVVDELPADPFDMEIKSTFTAITGWFQDSEEEFDDICLEFDDICLFEVDESEKEMTDHKHISGFNFVWNSTVRVQQQKGNLKIDEISIPYGSFSRYGIENENYDGAFASTSNVNNGVVADEDEGDDSSCGEGGAPHDALFFALGYLGVKDLLAVERVCRSFRDTVRSDPLLWTNIHIDQPLSEKITDDVLVNLSGRAQGILQSLSLMGCSRITDGGLRHVLESNPRLTKVRICGIIKLFLIQI